VLSFQVTFSSKPVCLISFVSPDNVASFVGLEIPWRDQNDVSHPYPHSPLHFPAYPAEAFMSVLASHQKSVEAKHFFGYAYYIVASRQLDGVMVFAFDFPFAHDTTFTLSLHKRLHNLNTLVFFSDITSKLKKFS
jgi:hypothetical protein